MDGDDGDGGCGLLSGCGGWRGRVGRKGGGPGGSPNSPGWRRGMIGVEELLHIGTDVSKDIGEHIPHVLLEHRLDIFHTVRVAAQLIAALGGVHAVARDFVLALADELGADARHGWAHHAVEEMMPLYI